VAQQAFSSELSTTLHLAIPALAKYACFAPALLSAAQKLNKYYKKTTGSPAYVMTMCTLSCMVYDPYHDRYTDKE
jgi:hypothetical protein